MAKSKKNAKPEPDAPIPAPQQPQQQQQQPPPPPAEAEAEADAIPSIELTPEEEAAVGFIHLGLAPTPSTASFSVSVGPVVFFSVLDHYIRRHESLTRVMGVLLGVRSEDGAEVEVRNCFPLSHTETEDSIAIDPDYLQKMYSLHQRVNPKEVIVGWYATGHAVIENSVHIHDFFHTETQPFQPVHLLVDTTLKAERLGIQAFVSSPVGAPGSEFPGALFVQVPCQVKLAEGERSGLDIISMAKANPSGASTLSDIDSLERSIVMIDEMLESVANYVAAVRNGEIEGNTAIGRFLMDTISSIPRIDPAAFEKMFSSQLQDMLMVVYLANLTRTQLAIAHRLHDLID